ncbi:glycosyltransferase family 4 protein [Nocardioides xinjiangensis]|uniref:glycosyltransferase family 4 protein n=1 Tax=Nocardioides xinjiangensis TaxID=2817376 RepID=UPI001B309214|nr:glycosyltransferase family 4 protein [Nocardioides sp. SYSU D00514]
MTRALILAERNFDTWHQQYLRGEAIAPLPYGLEALERHGFQLEWARRQEAAPWRKPRDVFEHRTGIPVERAIRGARLAAEADVVIALLEQQGYAVGRAKRWSIPPYARTPLVIWTCWLADELVTATPRRRSWLLRNVAAADLITYFGPSGADVLADMGFSAERILELTWGVTTAFYAPGDRARDIQVLAVGQDRGRDYGSLLAAFEALDFPLDLVCKPENIAGLRVPANVRLHGTVGMAEYRALLQRAQVVAVPTHELVYPTGSSVALEAASTGCAVVATATPGLSAYFDDGVDGRLVPRGDVDGWRQVLRELVTDEPQRERLGAAARERVVRRNSSEVMWRELAQALDERGLTTTSRTAT